MASTFGAILCVVNHAENSGDIAFYARELAQANNAKIVLFHSVPRTDNLFKLADALGGPEAARKDAEKKAMDFLDKLIAEEFENVDVTKEISDKDIVNNITELVEEHCADLVIMGSVSSKGLGGFFSVDNSKGVIQKTRIPVLVVPNDLTLECTPDFE